MHDSRKDSSFSPFLYALGGVAVGVAAGLLLAPKKGSETREDINALRLRAREKTLSAIGRVGKLIPARVKAAAAFGAAKDGAGEAFNEARDSAKEFVGS